MVKSRAISLLLMGAMIGGCGNSVKMSSSSTQFTSACVLKDDQVSTLQGKWPILPLNVAFVTTGNWTTEEKASITAAIDTWNTFFKASKGLTLINYKASDGTVALKEGGRSNICGTSMISGTSYTGAVVLHKVASSWSGGSDVMALTTTCPQPANPISQFNNAMIEINYENFFTGSNRKPDMQTILLHEFGHLIGLRHSCENNSSETGMPNCNGSISSDYRAALMFPVFGWNGTSGEQKRDIRTNDQQRANCLY